MNVALQALFGLLYVARESNMKRQQTRHILCAFTCTALARAHPIRAAPAPLNFPPLYCRQKNNQVNSQTPTREKYTRNNAWSSHVDWILGLSSVLLYKYRNFIWEKWFPWRRPRSSSAPDQTSNEQGRGIHSLVGPRGAHARPGPLPSVGRHRSLSLSFSLSFSLSLSLSPYLSLSLSLWRKSEKISSLQTATIKISCWARSLSLSIHITFEPNFGRKKNPLKQFMNVSSVNTLVKNTHGKPGNYCLFLRCHSVCESVRQLLGFPHLEIHTLQYVITCCHFLLGTIFQPDLRSSVVCVVACARDNISHHRPTQSSRRHASVVGTGLRPKRTAFYFCANIFGEVGIATKWTRYWVLKKDIQRIKRVTMVLLIWDSKFATLWPGKLELEYSKRADQSLRNNIQVSF